MVVSVSCVRIPGIYRWAEVKLAVGETVCWVENGLYRLTETRPCFQNRVYILWASEILFG